MIPCAIAHNGKKKKKCPPRKRLVKERKLSFLGYYTANKKNEAYLYTLAWTILINCTKLKKIPKQHYNMLLLVEKGVYVCVLVCA